GGIASDLSKLLYSGWTFAGSGVAWFNAIAIGHFSISGGVGCQRWLIFAVLIRRVGICDGGIAGRAEPDIAQDQFGIVLFHRIIQRAGIGDDLIRLAGASRLHGRGVGTGNNTFYFHAHLLR